MTKDIGWAQAARKANDEERVLHEARVGRIAKLLEHLDEIDPRNWEAQARAILDAVKLMLQKPFREGFVQFEADGSGVIISHDGSRRTIPPYQSKAKVKV
jgi:predicted RNA binding protein YcfA (HicA-like mRNA interferase family)